MTGCESFEILTSPCFRAKLMELSETMWRCLLLYSEKYSSGQIADKEIMISPVSACAIKIFSDTCGRSLACTIHWEKKTDRTFGTLLWEEGFAYNTENAIAYRNGSLWTAQQTHDILLNHLLPAVIRYFQKQTGLFSFPSRILHRRGASADILLKKHVFSRKLS